jgi:Ca2+-transporting ATPase
VSIHEVVVGDIVVVGSGDKIPCDGVLIECYDVTANESSLTGARRRIALSCTVPPPHHTSTLSYPPTHLLASVVTTPLHLLTSLRPSPPLA